ncbi:MAG: hypothetical protein ABIH46_09650 [Chloroflexota bacterium]
MQRERLVDVLGWFMHDEEVTKARGLAFLALQPSLGEEDFLK